jgi:hypothetical protein
MILKIIIAIKIIVLFTFAEIIGQIYTCGQVNVRCYLKTNHIGYIERYHYPQTQNHLFNIYSIHEIKSNATWYCIDTNESLYICSNKYTQILPIEKIADKLIDDNDFTNNAFNYGDVKRFFKSFKYNNFTDKQIRFIYEQCKEYKINYLVIASKLEQESSLTMNCMSKDDYNWRMNRAMGYFLQSRTRTNTGWHYPYGCFESQIKHGTRILRKWYDRFCKDGDKQIYIKQTKQYVKPRNAASYALYQYTPIYSWVDDGRKEVSIGNKLFVDYFELFKKIDNKLRGEK